MRKPVITKPPVSRTAYRELLALSFALLALILSLERCGDEKSITGPITGPQSGAATRGRADISQVQEEDGSQAKTHHHTPRPTGVPRLTQTPTATPTRTPSVTVRVKIVGTVFAPSTVTIRVGDRVDWFWAEKGVHSTTSGGCTSDSAKCGTSCKADGLWDSGLHSPGYVYSHTFSQIGSFPYFDQTERPNGKCQAIGTVVVVP